MQAPCQTQDEALLASSKIVILIAAGAAEHLGNICCTNKVDRLRSQITLLGVKVFQFALAQVLECAFSNNSNEQILCDSFNYPFLYGHLEHTSYSCSASFT